MTGESPVPVHELTALELKERMDRHDEIVLVDVREQWERQIIDLPEYGQRHLPLGELPARYGEIDQSAEIVVYCRSGARSDSAAQFLRQAGFGTVLNLVGGVLGWRETVDPTLEAY